MNNNLISEISIDDIRQKCISGNLRWSNHIFIKFVERGINKADIICALLNGEVIEQYPNDYPYPSCLILGFTVDNNYIHVVCGMSESELHLITAYYPDTDEWIDDFKIRKEPKVK